MHKTCVYRFGKTGEGRICNKPVLSDDYETCKDHTFLEQVDPKLNTCHYKLISGPRKGHFCTEKAAENSQNFCEKHQKLVENVCEFVMTKGPKKNQPCGKKCWNDGFCAKHWAIYHREHGYVPTMVESASNSASNPASNPESAPNPEPIVKTKKFKAPRCSHKITTMHRNCKNKPQNNGYCHTHQKLATDDEIKEVSICQAEVIKKRNCAKKAGQNGYCHVHADFASN